MSKCLLSFDVSVAKKLNSLSSTVLLSFFQLKAAKEGNQFKADAIEIEKKTSLSRRQQVLARKILIKNGYLEEELKGMPSTLHFSVSFKEELFSLTERKHPSPLSVDLKAEITRDGILRGVYDLRPLKTNVGDLRLIEAILVEWANAWGKNVKRLTVNAERKKIWSKAMKDEITPSMFLKAVWGMKHDDWEERKNRNGWLYVVRHLERWVELFDEHGVEKKDLSSMKKIRGVTVPVDYAWDQSDEHLLQLGNRFDPFSKKWVSKTSEQYGSLLKYNSGENKNGTRKKSW